jgi:hypothetical protein
LLVNNAGALAVPLVLRELRAILERVLDAPEIVLLVSVCVPETVSTATPLA